MDFKTFSLNDILKDLEKKAGFEEGNPGAKGKDGKPEGDEENKKEKPEDKKDEGESKKDEKAEQLKEAALKSGADLAKALIEKTAAQKAANTKTNKGEEMDKQAEVAGKALAQALMKQAGIGDVVPTNGIPSGVVPNKAQEDNAAMVSQHDMVIQNIPGTDGRGNGGTINQIFDAITADAMAQGVKDEKVTGGVAPAEGAPNSRQAPAQVPIESPADLGQNQEKMAAVNALITQGYDFDQAVNLVKRASDELDAEELTQVKAAAFNELLAQGLSFSDAATLIKQAELSDQVDIEKKAALDQLMAHGVDFDQALALVEAKAAQLYGN